MARQTRLDRPALLAYLAEQAQKGGVWRQRYANELIKEGRHAEAAQELAKNGPTEAAMTAALQLR